MNSVEDNVQALVLALQCALKTSVTTGQIILNMHDRKLASYTTNERFDVKSLDKRSASSSR